MTEPVYTIAVDTGGTFTDLLVEDGSGRPRLYKRGTTPSDPVGGLFAALDAAAADMRVRLDTILARTALFVFGTTRATNAIVTRSTARTALLVTKGHPDVLLFREGGGRRSLFDYSEEYPEPYIPRSLTFELKERVLSDGRILIPLDEGEVRRVLEHLGEQSVEAVAVCLLWSVVNNEHEERVGRLLEHCLPDTPYTLSSRLNPTIREYRRMSSTAIDASLKPLMSAFFRRMEAALKSHGFRGRLLIMTSAGGVLDAATVADAPIHSIGSGPAGAPIAGRYFASLETESRTAIVTDAGGTTFDVSLLRDDEIPRTRETLVSNEGGTYITGFPSVDVRSVGAGGGSIAWVDTGGMLHVGPESAGADPGPVCYGRGNARPTITDACLTLGYLDPDYFLGGGIAVDKGLASDSIRRHIASPLGLDVLEASYAILSLGIDRMVTAIEAITLNQGIDPQDSLLIGGGGGAGLYSAGIAKQLGCWPVLVPGASAALSATGALLSDLQTDFANTQLMSCNDFDFRAANAILEQLDDKCARFVEKSRTDPEHATIRYFAEARYPHQVWEVSVPLPTSRFSTPDQVHDFVSAFHAAHNALFAIEDRESDVEIVLWRAQVSCNLEKSATMRSPTAVGAPGRSVHRDAYFPSRGTVRTPVQQIHELDVGNRYPGPLLVESPVTTLVVDEFAEIVRTQNGSILIYPVS